VGDANGGEFVVEKIEPIGWKGAIYFIVSDAGNQESGTMWVFLCNIEAKDWEKAQKLSLLNFSEEGIRKDFESGEDVQLNSGTYGVFVMKKGVFLDPNEHE